MSTIRLSDKTKKRFDKIQATLSARIGKNVSQDKTQELLIELWEQEEAGVNP